MLVNHITPPCPVCNQRSLFRLDPIKFHRWKNGALVQHVWPELSADERELIQTGTHPECWGELLSIPPERKRMSNTRLIIQTALFVLAMLGTLWAGYDWGYERAQAKYCTHGESSALYDSRTGVTTYLGETGCTGG